MKSPFVKGKESQLRGQKLTMVITHSSFVMGPDFPQVVLPKTLPSIHFASPRQGLWAPATHCRIKNTPGALPRWWWNVDPGGVCRPFGDISQTLVGSPTHCRITSRLEIVFWFYFCMQTGGGDDFFPLEKKHNEMRVFGAWKRMERRSRCILPGNLTVCPQKHEEDTPFLLAFGNLFNFRWV